MPYSSNATLLVEVELDGIHLAAIYKPLQGERPLWDFPNGLCFREVAAFELSNSLGWELIPPTVLRHDAPYGLGSLQLFIDARFEEHYFSLMTNSQLFDQFIAFCAFDLIGNNTDRKSGHILIDRQDHLWGIDHGLMFHEVPKLRTVIWEFGGAELSAHHLDDIARVSRNAQLIFGQLLSETEIMAFQARSQYIISRKKLPRLDPEARPYPWPLV